MSLSTQMLRWLVMDESPRLTTVEAEPLVVTSIAVGVESPVIIWTEAPNAHRLSVCDSLPMLRLVCLRRKPLPL